MLAAVPARPSKPCSVWLPRVPDLLARKEDLDAAFSYSEVYNYVGWPAAVVPGGTSEEGLPMGIEIGAPPWREDVALALAHRLETELGGWRPPAL